MFLASARLFLPEAKVFLASARLFLGKFKVFLASTWLVLAKVKVFLASARLFLASVRLFLASARLLLVQNGLGVFSFSDVEGQDSGEEREEDVHHIRDAVVRLGRQFFAERILQQ